MKIRQKRPREFVSGNICRRSELLALTKRHEMIFPCPQSSRSIQPAFQEMKSRRTVVVVMEIVLARPQQLDGKTRLLRNRRGLEHVIVRQPAPKSSARAFQMHNDVVVWNSQNLRHLQPPRFRRLTRRPELQLAIMKM